VLLVEVDDAEVRIGEVGHVGEGARLGVGVGRAGREVDARALVERRVEGEGVGAAAGAHHALDLVALGVVDVHEARVEARDEHARAPPPLAVDDRAHLHRRDAGRQRDEVVEAHEVARAGRRHVDRRLAHEQRRRRARGDVDLDRHRRARLGARPVARRARRLARLARPRVDRDAARVVAARRHRHRRRAAEPEERPVGRRGAVVEVHEPVDPRRVAVRDEEARPVGDVAELAHQPRHRQRRDARRPPLQPPEHERQRRPRGRLLARPLEAARRPRRPPVDEQAHQAPRLVRHRDGVAAGGRRHGERLGRQRDGARGVGRVLAGLVRGAAAAPPGRLVAPEAERLRPDPIVVDVEPRERRVAAHDHRQARGALAPRRVRHHFVGRGEEERVGRERAERHGAAQNWPAVGLAPRAHVDLAAATRVERLLGRRPLAQAELAARGARAPQLGHRRPQLHQVERLDGAAGVLQVEVAVDYEERRAARRRGERGRKVKLADGRRRPFVAGKAARQADQGGGGARGDGRRRHPTGAVTLHDARSVVAPHGKKREKVGRVRKRTGRGRRLSKRPGASPQRCRSVVAKGGPCAALGRTL
jgi:hypothetical protein